MLHSFRTVILLYFHRCVCNIDCSHISFNPVCASDGKSYDNPCQIKEASCQKQEKIEVKYLGRCQGNACSKINFEDRISFFLCRQNSWKIPKCLFIGAFISLLYIILLFTKCYWSFYIITKYAAYFCIFTCCI